MTTTDRPYPFFSVNADKFIAREGEHDVEYDLGQCWIAYNDIVDLYEAAADVVDGGGDGEMAKLRDMVIKVNDDFKKAGLMIDVKEIVTKKPRWKCDQPDGYDERHAREWMERHPHGWYNSESDYGTGDEDKTSCCTCCRSL